MPSMAAEFEEALKPIFQFITNPNVISFEDDILILIKSMIKKSKKVSPILWEMFDLLPNVLVKNKGQMGDLLDTVNYFMIYGKDEFAQR